MEQGAVEAAKWGTAEWGALAAWVSALATLLIGVFAVRINSKIGRASQRIRWLTGMMESHSEKMLWLELQRGIKGDGSEPIPVIWYDPSVTRFPRGAEFYKVGEEVKFEQMYLGIPEDFRVKRKGEE